MRTDFYAGGQRSDSIIFNLFENNSIAENKYWITQWFSHTNQACIMNTLAVLMGNFSSELSRMRKNLSAAVACRVHRAN
jgi:hypothetical protein